jgi:hypothetical protein
MAPNKVNIKKIFYNNLTKNKINAKFAKLTSNVMTKNAFTLVLDSVERNTCHYLEKQGISKENILLVEMNKPVADTHLEAGYACHNGSLEDFASERWDKPYRENGQAWRKYPCSSAYFDMYGRLDTQKRGIIRTIRRLNLLPNAVLAFTFCRRGMSNDAFECHLKIFLDALSIKKFKICFKKYYSGDGCGSRGSPMCTIIIKLA